MLRDRTLLESALARPRQLDAYAEAPDLIDMAAAYTCGIVRNHPFIDGTKRTGFLVGVLFLEIDAYLTAHLRNNPAKVERALRDPVDRPRRDSRPVWAYAQPSIAAEQSTARRPCTKSEVSNFTGCSRRPTRCGIRASSNRNHLTRISILNTAS